MNVYFYKKQITFTIEGNPLICMYMKEESFYSSIPWVLNLNIGGGFLAHHRRLDQYNAARLKIIFYKIQYPRPRDIQLGRAVILSYLMINDLFTYNALSGKINGKS